MAVRLRAAVVAAAVVVGAVVAPVAHAAPALRWAQAATAAIHPGVLTETAGGGVCTSDFVFTAGRDVYLGEAAHCGSRCPLRGRVQHGLPVRGGGA